MAFPPSSRLTYEDYCSFPDDGQRWEIIDGEAHVNPAPNTRHQRVLLQVAVQLKVHVEAHGGGEVFVAPYDVVLSEHDIVQPDVLFIGEADAHQITDANLQGVPTLAVEVLSNPRHDRVRKRRLYERAGVREYWIVDPDADRVEVYRRAGDGSGYPPPMIYEAGMTLTTDLLPGLAIDVAALFS